MNFLQVYDAIDIIHDVIITVNPSPNSAKIVVIDLRINKDRRIRR